MVTTIAAVLASAVVVVAVVGVETSKHLDNSRSTRSSNHGTSVSNSINSGDNMYFALRAHNRKVLRRLSRPPAFALIAFALALVALALAFADTLRGSATLRRSTSL